MVDLLVTSETVEEHVEYWHTPDVQGRVEAINKRDLAAQVAATLQRGYFGFRYFSTIRAKGSFKGSVCNIVVPSLNASGNYFVRGQEFRRSDVLVAPQDFPQYALETIDRGKWQRFLLLNDTRSDPIMNGLPPTRLIELKPTDQILNPADYGC